MNRLFLTAIAALTLSLSAFAKENLNIVFVGNSISYGAELKDRDTECPPVKVEEYIEANSSYDVNISNCGVCGATTVDFLPANETLFVNVANAANEFAKQKGQLVFTISLGTNDSACSGPLGSPVVPTQYYTNLKVIIDELLTSYPKSIVVLQYPLWYSPNTYNGAMYLNAGLQRLESYFPYITKLIDAYGKTHPNRVFPGNPNAFNTFKEHGLEYLTPENGNAGTFYLHPNKQGAEVLGKIWAETILKALKK